MQKKTNLLRHMAVFGLLLTTIMFFSNCKKDDSSEFASPIENANLLTDSTNQLAVAAAKKVTLDVKTSRSDGGFAYKIGEPLAISGDTENKPTQSTLRLFENGVELTESHAVHEDIRKKGKGRFSHWGTALIFSASDNTDPRTNGRTYTYTTDASSGTISPAAPSLPTAPVTSTPIDASGLIGYATVNGTTTGGKGGAELTVSSLATLKAALSDNAAKIVYITGTIKGSGNEVVRVGSNKTIIGKSGATLEGINLYIYTVSNIIIQNITFKNYVTDAAVQIKDKAHHVWVDHCDFSTDRSHGWDYWGKDIAITRESDYVTVSWSKFHDTNLSVLISGGIEGHEADAGKLHVTMHHNYWYNVSEREPSINYGRLHMFNNYHLNNGGYSIGARAGAIVRTDNEYFSNCHTPVSSAVAKDPVGYFSGLSTNVYNNSGANNLTTTESTWKPEYEYKAAVNDAASVPTLVMNGAGPK